MVAPAYIIPNCAPMEMSVTVCHTRTRCASEAMSRPGPSLTRRVGVGRCANRAKSFWFRAIASFQALRDFAGRSWLSKSRERNAEQRLRISFRQHPHREFTTKARRHKRANGTTSSGNLASMRGRESSRQPVAEFTEIPMNFVLSCLGGRNRANTPPVRARTLFRTPGRVRPCALSEQNSSLLVSRLLRHCRPFESVLSGNTSFARVFACRSFDVTDGCCC